MRNDLLKKVTVLGLCMLLLGGCGAKNNEPDETVEPAPEINSPEPPTAYGIDDYFPPTDNTAYKYTGMGSEALNQQAFTLYSGKQGRQIFTENYEYQATDVYRIENGELRVIYNDMNYYFDNLLETPDVRHMVILKEPFEVGRVWNYNSEGVVCEITSLNAAVKVPYGEFVTMEVQINHSDVIQKDYYAPGVGLVKTSYKMGQAEISMELSEIVQNTTKEVAVDFFTAGGGIEKRPLVLHTNMDLTAYLNAELKNAALLTAESEILSTSIDWVKVLLTVDLSAEPERDVLQPLADTLGNFYNVTNVEFLLNGSKSETLSPDGEYWSVEPIEPSEAAE